MKNIANCKDISGEEIGTVSVSIYKDKESGLSSFHIDTENDDVVQVSYVIEDTLKMF